MSRIYTKLTFTDSVKRVQQRYGSRQQAAKMEQMDWPDERLTDRESEFISQRDGFYVATVGENGWPYVQFRGGPKGFLKVLDDQTLGFVDFRGNRQYITTGNVRHDNRVAFFVMDYANRRRLKIMARAEIFDAEERPDLLAKLLKVDLILVEVCLQLRPFFGQHSDNITGRTFVVLFDKGQVSLNDCIDNGRR